MTPLVQYVHDDLIVLDTPFTELKSEIQAANVKFMDAFARQDANAVGGLYTSDSKIMPTGSDVVNGPAGIAIKSNLVTLSLSLVICKHCNIVYKFGCL